VQNYALEFTQENKGKWLQPDQLASFCLLIKQEVIKRIGPDLDKWTDLSLFDTDILSAKAREASYKLAVCRDLFIHHFGTRTFAHSAPQSPDQAQPASGKMGRESS
jgi:GT2 family glycosyltransferase